MDFNEFVDVKGGEHLTYVKTGVLWLEKSPYYYLEWVREPSGSYMVVYDVHEGTEDNPKKKAKKVVTTHSKFSDKTRLGTLANVMFPSRKSENWIPDNPLFVAPVLPNYTDTFTKKRESGFFEREPDRTEFVGGEFKMVRGNNTGVFIGVSSINWEDGFTIPTASVLEQFNLQKQSMFFDLMGDNNDHSNPLSSQYNKKKSGF